MSPSLSCGNWHSKVFSTRTLRLALCSRIPLPARERGTLSSGAPLPKCRGEERPHQTANVTKVCKNFLAARGIRILLALALDGAAECSHGWSGAEPVECKTMIPPRMGRRNCRLGAIPLVCRKPAASSTVPSPLRGENAWMVNHGLRGDGCALAPLHPWLHSGAPSGAKTNWVAGKARTMG